MAINESNPKKDLKAIYEEKPQKEIWSRSRKYRQ